jgi:hypothetical protein
MENLTPLSNYQPAPTANMQNGGRRHKKKSKRGGANPEDYMDYDKNIDQLEKGLGSVNKDDYPIDIFADEEEYDDLESGVVAVKTGGSRKRKYKRHTKKRSVKKQKAGRRKTRRHRKRG